jgi:hypothetical protein
MIFGYGFHSVIGYVIKNNGGVDSGYALSAGISIIPMALIIGVIGFTAIAISDIRIKNKKHALQSN